jgi:small subunit ribosomal protein S18
MARQQRTRTKREDRDRRPKKKVSILDQERVEWVDYKDVNLLRRFMSERAKIRARRVTGNDAQQQRAVARAIRVAREMALLPYSVRQVTHRSKGGKGGRGDRGDRGDRGELAAMPPGMPTEPPPPPDGSAAPDPMLEDGTDDMVGIESDADLGGEADLSVDADLGGEAVAVGVDEETPE